MTWRRRAQAGARQPLEQLAGLSQHSGGERSRPGSTRLVGCSPRADSNRPESHEAYTV